ncbi:MAG: glycosyltransferase [Clostridia bacterium]|nr:glycosyltransferase [Clostridia bacterium]
MSKLEKIKNYYEDNGLIGTATWLIVKLSDRVFPHKGASFDFGEVRIKETSKEYLTYKTAPKVFIIASIPYYDIGGGQRCSQLAKTFNKMGFDTYYYYAFPSSESKLFHIPMPMSYHKYIDRDSIEDMRRNAKRGDLVIFESPSVKFAEILDIASERGCRIIYENIDNWETSLGSTVYDEEMLVKLLRASSALVGTAKPLVEQLKGYLVKYGIGEKPILYLPNAVDDELFCALRVNDKPSDLVTGDVTLLYYGSLWGEWFDWDIVTGLASRHPEYSFNIIGDSSHSTLSAKIKSCPDNVHFLGLKRQTELPAYLSHVDYAMIPFKPGEIGDYVSPLKIFEYISMYRRVLCTSLPDVSGYPNMYCGDTAEEWEKIIEADYPLDTDAADSFSEDNSWSNRVGEMLGAVCPELDESVFKDKLSVIFLNYNNKNIIFKSVNSVLKYNRVYNAEVIVVDNGSTDGSYEALLEKYSDGRAKILRNEKNGCSSGRNLGVANSSGEYILFLDSDQWITNDYWLLPYENVRASVPDVGLIGWAAGFFNKANKAYHVVDSFPYRYMPPNALCRYDIGYLGSGGMLITRADFDKVDGFDTFYDPTCYEDTDLSFKVKNTGKKVLYCPYIGLIHLPHQTTNSGSDAHTKLMTEKQEYFTAKWMKENPSLFEFRKQSTDYNYKVLS